LQQLADFVAHPHAACEGEHVRSLVWPKRQPLLRNSARHLIKSQTELTDVRELSELVKVSGRQAVIQAD
jgi:hypothetical protein